MKKKNLFISLLLIAIIFLIASKANKKTIASPEKIKTQIAVEIKPANDATKIIQSVNYSANVIGDQEIKIVAKANGVAEAVNFDLGSKVGAGKVLVRIDDQGNTLSSSVQGFQSSQIQQSDLAVKQAKKAYELAKDNYSNLKDSGASESQIESAKAQRDIAKYQLENATIGLNGNLDNRMITSPVSGIVTKKAVSIGDSVSAGQLLAVVSKTNNVKVQFYVNQNEQAQLKSGQEIMAQESNGNITDLYIKNISPVADAASKRFLIEAFPKNPSGTLISGTIVNVKLSFEKNAQGENNLILPLSAISVGQNENFIFLAQDSKAKKTLVTIQKVDGETAEVSFDRVGNEQIIIEGNKLVQDGSEITVTN